MASKVFFSREITPEKVVEMYQLAGKELSGKVAVKLHSGEEGNQNFLRPEFWKEQKRLQGIMICFFPGREVMYFRKP